jgi:hypothetical protein
MRGVLRTNHRHFTDKSRSFAIRADAAAKVKDQGKARRDKPFYCSRL